MTLPTLIAYAWLATAAFTVYLAAGRNIPILHAFAPIRSYPDVQLWKTGRMARLPDQEVTRAGQGPRKYEKIPMRQTRREAHAVTIGNIPSLDWFQVISNGKSRFMGDFNV
jgi:hypothetical protein